MPLDDLEILPGNPGTPLFKSPEEQDRWSEKFYESVRPELERLEEARRRSYHECYGIGRPVD